MIIHFKENQTRIFSYLSMQSEAISVAIKINPLMPGGNKKVTHIYTNLQLSGAGLFDYV